MRDRCAHARATRTRAAGGEHRRGWTRSQSAPVAQPSAVLVVKTGRLRRASEPQREKTNPVIAWISLYSLVAVGLPHHHGVGVGGLAGGDHGGLVEDGGDGGDSGHFVCSCGYAGTSAALRAFVLFPGYAEVGPAHEASLELEVGNSSGKKHDKTEACFWSCGRIYGVCSIITPKSPSHGKNRL